MIQSDERAFFQLTYAKQVLIVRATESFLQDVIGIVPRLDQHLERASTQILVELKFHAAFSVATGIMCSRAIKAP